ncbi:MAG: EamA family transporter [Candidatus Buchananbacteria bacterium CG10_big_fil_rev_8_21_14_0_10_42_9]|uniref:EamA family transporter n=1 Tax=Candidatus Buchananbacteria bacterium CG10_big_fil_rev_8_21_14_0_10_42_9 TaxID=1974526 RepID=A0A2H0W018_9BACT|nr:MAG: EamA family transporter [Candidatus Buchananbacteria bacterium CG10_big_fil_rev_8_21_14_0_10_42_9]
METTSSKFTKTGPLLIILAAFLWSLDGFLRQSLYSLPSTLIVFLEHVLGFIVTLPFLIKLWPNLKKITKTDWFSVLWVAFLGGVLGTVFFTKALGLVGYIDLSVVILLQKLQPIFAITLAIIILKEKPSHRYWWYVIVALIGGYLVTFKNFLPNLSHDSATLFAALLAIGAAFAWGSSTVFGRKALNNIDFKLLTSIRFGLTSIILIPVLFLLNTASNISQINSQQWGALIAIVFSTGLVAVFIYYAGLRSTRASIATICEMFWPVSAIFLDFFINRVILSPSQILGAILLLYAIYKISRNQNIVKAEA